MKTLKRKTLKEKADAIIAELKEKLGTNNFNNLRLWAFEYACQEADSFQGIKKEGDYFRKIVEGRTSEIMLSVHESLGWTRHDYTKTHILLPKKEEIAEFLRQEYYEHVPASYVIMGNSLIRIINLDKMR